MPFYKILLLLLFGASSFLFSCTPEAPGGKTFDRTAYFEYLISTLDQASLPLRMEGHPKRAVEPDAEPLDSIFLSNFLDSNFFEVIEAQYTYGQARLVSRQEDLIVLLIPISFPIGHKHLIYTFNGEGRQLDSLTVAATVADNYYRSSKIERDLKIELREVTLIDVENTDGFVRKATYRIDEQGRIRLSGEVKPGDWAGRWKWSDNQLLRETTLDIEPAGDGYIDFELTCMWGEDVKVRKLSGKARVEYNGAAYQKGACKIFFELERGVLIRLRHFNPESCPGLDGIDLSNQYDKSETGPEPDRQRPIAPKKILEDPERSIASCTAYKIIAATGEAVTLPQPIEALLECPSLLSLSPDSRYLAINDGLTVRLLDFLDLKTRELLVLRNDTDGISDGLWSPDGQTFAFIDINQDQYPDATQLFAFRIEDGRVIDKKERLIKVNRLCGASCHVEAGKDFWFKTNNVIGYHTYDKAPFDLEGKEADKALVL